MGTLAIIGNVVGAASNFVNTLYIGLTKSINPYSGTLSSFTDASGSVTDFEGVTHTSRTNEARFHGGRRVDNNWITAPRDLLDAAYATANGASKTSAETVTFSGAANGSCYQNYRTTAGAGEIWLMTADIALVSGVAPTSNGDVVLWARGTGLAANVSQYIGDQIAGADGRTLRVTVPATTNGIGTLIVALYVQNSAVYKFTNIQCERVDGSTNVTIPSEFTDAADYGAGINQLQYLTTTNNQGVEDGLVFFNGGARCIAAIGDSKIAGPEWDNILDLYPSISAHVVDRGHASYKLSAANETVAGQSIEAVWTADITNTLVDGAIIDAGINDILSAVSDPVPAMIATLTTLKAMADAANKTIYGVCEVTPFGNAGAWTSAREAYKDNYNNVELPAWCLANGVKILRTHDIVADPADNTALLAAYSIDWIHINTAGNTVIANYHETRLATELNGVRSRPVIPIAANVLDGLVSFTHTLNYVWPEKRRVSSNEFDATCTVNIIGTPTFAATNTIWQVQGTGGDHYRLIINAAGNIQFQKLVGVNIRSVTSAVSITGTTSPVTLHAYCDATGMYLDVSGAVTGSYSNGNTQSANLAGATVFSVGHFLGLAPAQVGIEGVKVK